MTESILEPELPIIDPHHHLWDIRTFTIPGDKPGEGAAEFRRSAHEEFPGCE